MEPVLLLNKNSPWVTVRKIFSRKWANILLPEYSGQYDLELPNQLPNKANIRVITNWFECRNTSIKYKTEKCALHATDPILSQVNLLKVSEHIFIYLSFVSTNRVGMAIPLVQNSLSEFQTIFLYWKSCFYYSNNYSIWYMYLW